MNLAELITHTFSNDNNVRSAAEKNLESLSIQDPVSFIYAAGSELANENSNEHIRQTAGILIKRALETSSIGAEKLWISIPTDVKEQIKTFILGTLATKIDGIRRVAAGLIAEICKIELPRNEWPDLIPLLAKNTSHQDVEIKKASIMALGYICENLKNMPNVLGADKIDNIIMSICLGLQDEETNLEIKRLAVKALDDSLIFMENYFAKKEIRDFVMNLLLKCCMHPDKLVKVKSLQCLIDACKIHYENMADYIQLLLKITAESIISTDKEIATPAIEIWITIAQEDKERSQGRSESGKNLVFDKKSLNLISYVCNELVPLLFQNLLNQSNVTNDDDEEEFSVLTSTSRCLSAICEAVGDTFLQLGTNFAGIYLQSQNPIQKRAALICFSCMLEGPSKENLYKVVSVALPVITAMLSEQAQIIQESAASTLARTAECLPESFLQGQNMIQLLPSLTQAIMAKPKVKFLLKYLSEYSKNIRQVSKSQKSGSQQAIISNQSSIVNTSLSIIRIIKFVLLGLNFDTVIDTLIKNAFRTDISKNELQLIENSFIAIMSLLVANKGPALNEKYLRIFVDQFKNTGNLTGERRTFIQNGLLASLHTCLMKFDSGKLDENIGQEIYLMVGELFKYTKDINADGIHVLGGLASALDRKFDKYAQDFWSVLLISLKRKDEPELFSASLGALIEVSKSSPDIISTYLQDLIPYLFALLQENFDKNLKLQIILAIGDIALACREKIAPFTEDLLKIYNMIIEAALQPPSTVNPELTDYLEQLRDNLLESYICFVHATEDTAKRNLIINHLPIIIEFLKKTCNETFNPTVDFLRNALTLIADIGNFFGTNVKDLIKTDFTSKLMEVLNKFTKNESNKKTLLYAQNVLANIQSIKVIHNNNMNISIRNIHIMTINYDAIMISPKINV